MFTATFHEKGPADALGAAVKSTTTRYLMCHGPEEAFTSAKELYELSQSPIELIYIESAKIVRLHQEMSTITSDNTNDM
jgi:hypothetical protein